LWQNDWVTMVAHANPGSSRHVGLHPSPAIVFPSSHCSWPATIPSPHAFAMQALPAA
jgi:hypothetical protein